MSEIKEDILKAVKEAVGSNGRLSCEKAHELAEKFEVSKAVIGEAAEQLKIRIAACQLGCF